MNTYTIRALTSTDRAQMIVAKGTYQEYREFIELPPGERGDGYPMWCGRLEVTVDVLLEIIERLTRPADVAPDESIVTDEDGALYRCVVCNAELVPFVNDYGRARMTHTEQAKAACLNPAAGWYRDRPADQPAGVSLASCGHPCNEDGECDCSSWPERAPLAARSRVERVTGTGWPA